MHTYQAPFLRNVKFQPSLNHGLLHSMLNSKLLQTEQEKKELENGECASGKGEIALWWTCSVGKKMCNTSLQVCQFHHWALPNQPCPETSGTEQICSDSKTKCDRIIFVQPPVMGCWPDTTEFSSLQCWNSNLHSEHDTMHTYPSEGSFILKLQ